MLHLPFSTRKTHSPPTHVSCTLIEVGAFASSSKLEGGPVGPVTQRHGHLAIRDVTTQRWAGEAIIDAGGATQLIA